MTIKMTQLRSLGGHKIFLTGLLSNFVLLNLTAFIEMATYQAIAMKPEEEDEKGLPFDLRLSNCLKAFALSSTLATLVTYPIEFYNIRVILRQFIVTSRCSIRKRSA
jgi:hypothetical protein